MIIGWKISLKFEVMYFEIKDELIMKRNDTRVKLVHDHHEKSHASEVGLCDECTLLLNTRWWYPIILRGNKMYCQCGIFVSLIMTLT